MSRMRRFSKRHHRVRTTAPVGASGASWALRRRVLASVRSDSERARPVGPGLHRRTICAVAIVVCVAAGTFLLGSPGRQPARREGGVAPTPSASLRRVGDRGELRLAAMPEPPEGEVYEVWLERAGHVPQPTDALFTVTSAGDGNVAIPGSLRGVREVMVTAEPLGGSSKPTSAAVLRVALARSG
jgi:Anti-sigma-K factor rskA